MKKYFLLNVDSDGDVYLSEYDAAGLTSALNEHDFGDNVTFATSVPRGELGDSEDRFWLVEGRLIQPVARTVAVTYDLPK